LTNFTEQQKRLDAYRTEVERYERFRGSYSEEGFQRVQGNLLKRRDLTEEQVTALDIVPTEFENAFSNAQKNGLLEMSNPEFFDFAKAYKEHGSKLFENDLLSAQYGKLINVLMSDDKARMVIQLIMKQESSNDVIKNKEFEIKVGAADRARVTTIRGENIRSFTRNV
ncbi:MAG: hypothetical protein LBP51_02665, partial [Deferribacteraceae bacterium]|jgi:hypothetical protein|nr:hypothetical protein [Deferribacteraceae bacterium]